MLQFLKTRTLAQHAGLLMITAGLMAFVFQAWKNARTATRFSEPGDWLIDAIGGIAPELFVAAAAVGVISLANQGKISSGKSLYALMTLCVGFGIFASFQQISVGRFERSASNDLASGNKAGRDVDLASARAQLASMAAVSSVGAAQGALDKLKTRKGWNETNGCANPGSFTVLCRQVADANAKLGEARRKEALEARVAQLQTSNETVKASNIAKADPAAEWLASTMGWQTNSAQMAIAGFMAVVMMLVGMFGVHFGLVVYGMDHAAPVAATTAQVFDFPAKPAPAIHDQAEWARGVLRAAGGRA